MKNDLKLSSKAVMETRIIAYLQELQLKEKDILKASSYADRVASIVKDRLKHRGLMLTEAYASICNVEAENVVLNEQIKHYGLIAECVTGEDLDYALKMIAGLKTHYGSNLIKLDALYKEEHKQWAVLSQTRDNELKAMREVDKQALLHSELKEKEIKKEFKIIAYIFLGALVVGVPLVIMFSK